MSEAAVSRVPLRKIIWRVALIALLVVLGAGAWLGYRAYNVYEGIEHITGQELTPAPGATVVPVPPINGNKRLNILVLGSDNDTKAQEARPLTQTIIVVSIDPVHDKVNVLSIPRDFYVPIRGFGMDKLDVASKDGGLALTEATVSRLFHIPIHFYAWVGLSGFRNVVDTFNGVDINVSHPILDDYYPDDQRPGDPYAYRRVFIPAGWRHLSGRQTLEYARSRHADLLGDFGRSARQQQVLLALRKKADVLNVLTNLPALVDDLQGSVKTDLSIMQIYQLAQLSRHIQSSDIHRVVLEAPTYCRFGFVGQESILIPNWTAIRPVVSSLFAPIATAPVPAKRLPGPATAPSTAPAQATPVPPHPIPLARATPTVPAPPAATATFGAMPGTLIFEREGNVFELTKSHQTVQLTTCNVVCNAIAMPSLSPDGRTLAFVRFSTSYASDVYLFDLRNHQVRQLTHDANATDVHNNLWAAFPSWSPDGKSILLSSDRAKLPLPESESRPIDLGVWSVPTNGGSWTQLTTPVQGAGGDTDGQWLPGTHQFLYVRWAYNSRRTCPIPNL